MFCSYLDPISMPHALLGGTELDPVLWLPPTSLLSSTQRVVILDVPCIYRTADLETIRVRFLQEAEQAAHGGGGVTIPGGFPET